MRNTINKIICGCICVCLTAFIFIFAACGDDVETENYCAHIWSAGTVVKDAECDKNGEMSFSCSECGDTKTEATSALGHKFPTTGTVTEQSNCVAEGVTSFECSVCGDVLTEAIPKSDHNYNDGEITTSPSCFGYGIKTFTCEACDDAYTESIEPIGHGDYDADGYCDACNEFTGVQEISTESVSLADGPWENPGGASWWSYGLEKSPSQETSIIVSTDEKVHTEGKNSIKIDFSAGSKCTPENAGGAYVVHFGVDDLQKKANYTLSFFAWASDDFTGNLNKMLNNDNFGSGNSTQSVSYQPIYGAQELAGKGWVEVLVTFNANPSVEHANRCGFRLAFDVGLAGWQGQLYVADVKVTLTDYLRAQAGLPPLNEPTKPVNTTPVLDALPENHIALPAELDEGQVWTPGPLYSGEAVFSIDSTVEYAKGSKSVLINLNKALTVNKESAIILPFGGLTEGKRYELTFWAQGSETYNGALSNIFGNPNYSHIVEGAEVSTMTEMIVNAQPLFTAGGMTAADWQKVSVIFTANPKDNLCSLRMQLTMLEGWKGQLWLSCFTIGDAPEIVTEGPQVTEPVLEELSANHVALPASIPSGGVWESGPLYSGDAVFSIDEEVEYAVGAKSIAIDYNAAAVGNESVLILPFSGLTEGERYELTFWAQGSVDFNGALNDVFENPNYTHMVAGAEVRTMLELTKNVGVACTAGGMLDAGWQKISVSFTANPLEGKCSLRIQFRKAEGWTGGLWLSYFEVNIAA